MENSNYLQQLKSEFSDLKDSDDSDLFKTFLSRLNSE